MQKMRAVCRRAGLTIPPNVYSKHKTDTSLEGALEGLLEKHRLHRKSTQAEIAAAHRRLQKEKDMEGEPCTSSPGPQVLPVQVYKPPSDLSWFILRDRYQQHRGGREASTEQGGLFDSAEAQV